MVSLSAVSRRYTYRRLRTLDRRYTYCGYRSEEKARRVTKQATPRPHERQLGGQAVSYQLNRAPGGNKLIRPYQDLTPAPKVA